MDNNEREEAIAALVQLVSTDDMDLILSKIPDARDDPDDVKVDEFFDALQKFYFLQHEWRYLDADEMNEIAVGVRDGFRKYGLSERPLWPFLKDGE